jgi:hypothetical protein
MNDVRMEIKNRWMRDYRELEEVALRKFGIKVEFIATRQYLYAKIERESIYKSKGYKTFEQFVDDIVMFYKYNI